MSKSDTPIQKIELSNAFKEQTKPQFADGKVINAFDTETFDGSVFMLSYAIGDDFSGVVTKSKNSIVELDSTSIFEKITHNNCRSAINVWYNLDFDANAILSGVLSERELTELAVTNGTITVINDVEYEIKYVKGKFLHISDSNNHNYSHFDISQFFYTSLDNAASEWLGKNKTEGIDTSKFSKENYILDNIDEIEEYAEKDAILTQELAHELIKEAEDLNIPMGRPFSTGYLSAEYFRENMDMKPNFGNVDYQSMFWKAYYGGRFEVFKRGAVGDIVGQDINSAYPAIMAEMPEPSTLDWEKYSNVDEENQYFGFADISFDFDKLKEADYGVIRAKVTTDPTEPIQPFAQKINAKVHYPVFTESEVITIKPIFEFAVENGLVLDYELKEAWLGYETNYTNYPFAFLKDLYSKRKWFEHNGNYRKGQLLKIVLNSGYGKTCQTTEYKRIEKLEENDILELQEYEKIYPKQFLSKNQRSMLKENEVVVSSISSGRRFNPFLASYITGMTRLELHKQVVNHNLVDNTVMFATDCIMLEKDAYESSNFDDLLLTPDDSIDDETKFKNQAKRSLGKWDFDYEGKGFVVGSGVYEVQMNTCQDKDCGDYKTTECDEKLHFNYTKTRGFTDKDLPNTLVDMAKSNPKGIPITNSRPLTMSEVLISPERGNVSQFVEDTKLLNPDFDNKRNWKKEKVDFEDLLLSKENSRPINLAEEQEKMLQSVQSKTTHFKFEDSEISEVKI